MAEPSGFMEANDSLGPPKGATEDQVRSLRVYRGHGCVISCWRLTAEELEEIKKTGRVWLRVMGDTMPPVFVTGQYPFEVHG